METINFKGVGQIKTKDKLIKYFENSLKSCYFFEKKKFYEFFLKKKKEVKNDKTRF